MRAALSTRRAATGVAGVIVLAVLALAAGLASLSANSESASATHVTPRLVEGNPTCQDLGYTFGFKPTSPAENNPFGTHTFTYTYANVTYTASVTISGTSTTINWSSTIPIDAVIVKAGDRANVYEYDPAATSDTGLQTPNNRGGQQAGLSHLVFCFGGTTNEGPQADVAVAKTAAGTYDLTHTWTIDKSVSPAVLNMFTGDSGSVEYTVSVDETVTPSNSRVTGTIIISNDGVINAYIASLNDIDDVLSDGTVATVACAGATFPVTIAPGGELQCTYTATPANANATSNTATVTYTDDNPDQDAPVSDSENITWTPTHVGSDSINVQDVLGTNTQNFGPFASDTTFSYRRTFTCDRDEGTHVNTATIVETGGSDTATVTVNCYSLTVTKTANTSLTRTWDWTIAKTADQTELTLASGQQFAVNYSVTVNATSTDSNRAVAGTITVANNTPLNATLTSVSDIVSNGINATVNCSVTFPYSLLAGQSLVCSYTAALPDATNRTNTATATLQNTPSGTTDFSGSASVSFANATVNHVDECVNVTDSLQGTLGTVCATDTLPKTFTYTRTITGGAACTQETIRNIATATTNDTSTVDRDDHSVVVTVDCGQCTLTQGYWKTHSDRGPAPYDDAWKNLGLLEEDTLFFLSGKTWYQVFWTPPAGNAYYNLAHQYMAAKLNILNGASAPSSVTAAISGAETFFSTYAPNATLTRAQRAQLLAWASTLDQYNNGIIGPGHCDQQ